MSGYQIELLQRAFRETWSTVINKKTWGIIFVVTVFLAQLFFTYQNEGIDKTIEIIGDIVRTGMVMVPVYFIIFCVHLFYITPSRMIHEKDQQIAELSLIAEKKKSEKLDPLVISNQPPSFPTNDFVSGLTDEDRTMAHKKNLAYFIIELKNPNEHVKISGISLLLLQIKPKIKFSHINKNSPATTDDIPLDRLKFAIDGELRTSLNPTQRSEVNLFSVKRIQEKITIRFERSAWSGLGKALSQFGNSFECKESQIYNFSVQIFADDLKPQIHEFKLKFSSDPKSPVFENVSSEISNS